MSTRASHKEAIADRHYSYSKLWSPVSELWSTVWSSATSIFTFQAMNRKPCTSDLQMAPGHCGFESTKSVNGFEVLSRFSLRWSLGIPWQVIGNRHQGQQPSFIMALLAPEGILDPRNMISQSPSIQAFGLMVGVLLDPPQPGFEPLTHHYFVAEFLPLVTRTARVSAHAQAK
ncbi:hypothetical protein VNO77_08740 [Canavalia gladiata]|uniref:Uncharacterized protein n=1 Tax=Canavalia gladiata TaxID=3824 RepID=A0AAN9R149_CANGL